MTVKQRGPYAEAPAALREQVGISLTSLGDPLGDVFAVVDEAQLNDLLNRVGRTKRTQLLQMLRVPAMGKLTPTISRHALAQLRSQRSSKYRPLEARILGGPLFEGLSQARRQWSEGHRDGVLESILEQSPRAELLLAAIAFWESDPGQARVLAWALRNRALPSWPAEHVSRLADDCDRFAQEWAERHLAHTAALNASLADHEGEGEAEAAEHVSVESVPQCDEIAERLQQLSARAAADLRQAAERVAAGALPDPGAWEAAQGLLTYLPAVRSALARASDQPIGDVPEDHQALAALLRERSRKLDRRTKWLPALKAATQAATSHETAAVGELRQQAARLLETEEWDASDAQLAALMADIVALAEAVTHDDDPRAEHLDSRLRDALSDRLRPVLLPLLRGKITFPQDTPAAAPLPPADSSRPSPAPGDATPTQDKALLSGDDASSTGADGTEATQPVARPANDEVPAAAHIPVPGQRETASSDGAQLQAPHTGTTALHTQKRASTTPPAPEPLLPDAVTAPAVAGDHTDPSHNTVARLLQAHEPALAYHVAQITDQNELATSLKLHVLSTAMRTATGPCAEAVHTEIAHLGVTMPEALPERLLLATSLFRACLVSADPAAGELLGPLTHSLHTMPSFRTTLAATAEACARGQLGVHSITFTDTDTDVDVTSVCALAREHLAEPRSLHFPRANDIVREWWSEHGPIGHILHAVARDDRPRLDAVQAELVALRKPDVLERRLTATDQQKRNNKARLQGAARRRILQYAHESLDVAHTWLTSVQSLESFQPPPVFSHLAQRAKDHATGMKAELAAASEEADPLLSATAALCAQAMQTSLGFLRTGRLSGAEPTVTTALNADLLRCADLDFDLELNPLRRVTIDDVGIAQQTGWETAARQHAAAENYATARTTLEMLESHAGSSESVGKLSEEQHRLLPESRKNVTTLHRDITHHAETAARLGQLPEPGRSHVMARLESAKRALHEDNLGTTRHECEGIVSQLNTLSEQAKNAFRAAATQQLNHSDARADLADEIRNLIAGGDLATAEEFLIAARDGISPPTANVVADFDAFFPAVHDALRSGITPELIRDASNGVQREALDFSELTPAQRSQAANAFAALQQLHGQWNTLRPKAKFQHLRPVLRLAGIEYDQERTTELPNPANRQWFDLTDVKLVGPAKLPQFGSGADGRLRVMITRSVSDARTLMGWIEQDVSQLPVLIVVASALSATQRRALAHECVSRRDKPILVLDACAVAFLAARGTGLFATTEHILAPFSSVTPYFPEASDTLPTEMFYGRREELSAVLDPQGSSIVYGGRRLGKSALLKAAAFRYRQTRHQESLYIPLPSGMGLTPEVLWDLLGSSLEQSGIAERRKHRASGMRQVEADIKAWLEQDKARKLLILFDECDEFFDGDASKGFVHTSALRNLMSASGRRFKPVFAGLHQVQRFAALPNQPLASAHFGEPLVIGPLSPAAAYRLLQEPMQALGIRFHSDMLIHRALAYANYHPKIIQNIGLALVHETHHHRTPADSPPWTIDEDMLERVIGSEALAKNIRDTVRLTLHLDPRYKLIALVVALHVHRKGVDVPIAGRALRVECTEWWPHALAATTPDEYRALLEEMTGLGVLTSDDTGWRLRSSNVLRLLGTPTSIEEELSVQESNAVTTLSATHGRRPLPPKARISPLTEAQIADLTTRRNGVRIVLGTPALGLDDVHGALNSQQQRIAGRLAPLIAPTTRVGYRKQLQTGAPGRQHRIILSDMRPFGREALRLALDQAIALQPQEGVTRCVVALVDSSNTDHMRELNGADEESMVFLKLATADGLRSWTSEQDAMAPYSDTALRDALLKATGGWPTLLNHVLETANRGRTPSKTLAQLQADLENTAGMSLMDDSGLASAIELHPLLHQIAEFDTPLPMEDLSELLQLEHPDAAHLLACLHRMNVLVDTGQQELVVEPVLAATWRRQGLQ
ncbi:hypothetical protein ACIBBB_27780 [Streptomyces sp. NPDC051217]|uniref:hypothetical protein n=1 Tax=Streptomyces sp. NPDC051217 TaxID=3365644 RepID=UPI0037AAF1AD